MTRRKPDSRLSSASEYALIFGAGASAAMSLAAQQVAAASVPVTALVAIGLMNRRRLDQQLQSGALDDSPTETPTARSTEPTTPPQVTAQPRAIAPRSHPSPAMANPPTTVRFSGKQQRRLAAKQALLTAQADALRSIGAQLRQIREEHQLSLHDIHQRTFIQRYALQAIESGDLEALPEPFYIRAFIQKYAIAIGLAGANLATQFPMTSEE